MKINNKDAYYFPHFSNARSDRKIKRLKKELGLVGYAIYFQLLEILREEPNYSYPLEDIDLLTNEIGCTEDELNNVIRNFKLFEVENDHFYSLKFKEYMKPYEESKARKKISSMKGNLIKGKHLSKEDAASITDDQLKALYDSVFPQYPTGSHMGAQTEPTGNPKGSPQHTQTKLNETKLNKTKIRDIYIPADFSNSQHSDSEEPLRAPPTREEFMNYCTFHGFKPKYAEHLFDTCSAHGWLTQKTRAPITDWQAYARSRFKWQSGFFASLNEKNGFKPNKPPSKFDSAEAFLDGIEIN